MAEKELAGSAQNGAGCGSRSCPKEQNVGGAWDGQRLQGKSFPGLGEFGLFAKCIGKPLRFLKPWVITVGFCYE